MLLIYLDVIVLDSLDDSVKYFNKWFYIDPITEIDHIFWNKLPSVALGLQLFCEYSIFDAMFENTVSLDSWRDRRQYIFEKIV